MSATLYSYCTDNDMEKLLLQWDKQDNYPITPENISYGSDKKVWWICDKGHKWMAKIRSRIQGRGCPICANKLLLAGVNDLQTKYPEIAREWHPVKNKNLTPDNVRCGSKQRVWWQCIHGHEWIASVQSRTLYKNNCPVCAGKKVISGENDLETYYPDIAKEWHPVKNGNLLPTQVTPYSSKKVWWLCKNGHEYVAQIGMRTIKNSSCPYCSGRKVLTGFNDLATKYPEIAKQWHPVLNGQLTPNKITPGSHKRAWWICSEGHVWNAVIYSRTGNQKRGCPVCAGRVKGNYLPQKILK